MSHTIFQAAQIMPIPTTEALSSKPLLPPPRAAVYRSLPAVPCKLLGKGLVVRASSSVVGGDAVAGLERCFRASPSSDLPATSSSSKEVYGPVMKGGQYGAFGATTLEKSKLDLSQKQTKSSPETAIGGGGGDIGKSINFGGGDGGDDNGDDDDYFDDFDEGDDGDEGGLFRRRIVLQELFDRKFIDAVLNEWQKTMMDLPAGLRQAYEMGLVSSAQMVKYLAMNARPTAARIISRKLPQGLSRAFIGRYKLERHDNDIHFPTN